MDERGRETIVFLRIVDACLHAHILESTVRLLMVEGIAFSGQTAWSTHHRHTAKLTKVLTYAARLVCLGGTPGKVVQVDLHVARDKQIQPAVSVVIAPGRSRAPAFARYTNFLRNVSERTVTVVVIQTRNAEVANVDVWPAVVIIVPDCHAHSPTFIGHSGFVSYVLELPITEVVVQRSARWLLFPLHRRDGRAI